MFGTSVPTDFSERICTMRSLASSPTWRLPSLTSERAVASAARNGAASISDEMTRSFPIHRLKLVFILGRIITGASSATTKDDGVYRVFIQFGVASTVRPRNGDALGWVSDVFVPALGLT